MKKVIHRKLRDLHPVPSLSEAPNEPRPMSKDDKMVEQLFCEQEHKTRGRPDIKAPKYCGLLLEVCLQGGSACHRPNLRQGKKAAETSAAARRKRRGKMKRRRGEERRRGRDLSSSSFICPFLLYSTAFLLFVYMHKVNVCTLSKSRRLFSRAEITCSILSETQNEELQ